jgi:very-short-patch-repair endonuclease
MADVIMGVRSAAEEVLEIQLKAANLIGFVREHRFHPVRKWRFDFAHLGHKLAVEIEGFAPGGKAGRHQRIGGFTADAEKYAEAAILGWRLIRVTTRQVRSGEALKWIERAMQ